MSRPQFGTMFAIPQTAGNRGEIWLGDCTTG